MVEVKQKVTLVDGQFTASEASHVLKSLIKEKINYHKLKRLSIHEGNILDDCTYDNSRINELEQEKVKIDNLLKEARHSNKKFKIEGTLQITLLDK